MRNALARRPVDRNPVDIGGTYVTGIHVDEYLAIARHFGMDVGMPRIYDQSVMLARFDESMRRRLHSDVILLENPVESWGIRNENWKQWTSPRGNKVLVPGGFDPVEGEDGYLYLRDVSGKRIAYKSRDSLYFEKYLDWYVPPAKLMSPDAWRTSIPLYSEEDLRLLQRQAEFLFQSTDYSVHGNFQKGKLSTTGLTAGHSYTDWLCVLLTETGYAAEILAATAERAVENARLYLQAVGSFIDTILVSTSDYGTQKCELFDPSLFRDLYAPNMKKINDAIHAASGVKVMYHSCGSIRNILGSMIDSGVDIVNPVQTSAASMDPAELKREFGHKVVFWGGGADTQGVLQFGSPDEVRIHVKERAAIFGRDGGWVFSPVHNVQYGVPPENVEAMIDSLIAG